MNPHFRLAYGRGGGVRVERALGSILRSSRLALTPAAGRGKMGAGGSSTCSGSMRRFLSWDFWR
jgi:hypothetical protein